MTDRPRVTVLIEQPDGTALRFTLPEAAVTVTLPGREMMALEAWGKHHGFVPGSYQPGQLTVSGAFHEWQEETVSELVASLQRGSASAGGGEE